MARCEGVDFREKGRELPKNQVHLKKKVVEEVVKRHRRRTVKLKSKSFCSKVFNAKLIERVHHSRQAD